MRNRKLWLVFFIVFVCSRVSANETVHFKVFLVNQYVRHSIEIYKFRRKLPAEILFETKTHKHKIYSFDYSIPLKAIDYPFEFWIFVKGPLHIGGRWIRVSDKYEPKKNLVIAFSPQMKRRYCYVTYWIDENVRMDFR